MSATLTQPAAFLALSRTRKCDPTLQAHALAVCTLAISLGQRFQYDTARLHNLATASLLHDVGLLRLPPYMIRLCHRLSRHERWLFDGHPQLSVQLLRREQSFPSEVLRMIGDHHTRPADRQAFSSEAGRILSVVDRYDELITGQFDQPRLSRDPALGHLYQEGQHGAVDGTVVSHLVQILGVYPLYSLVALSTGERGIVVEVIPHQAHRPVVLLIMNQQGRRLSCPRLLNLADQSAVTIHDVLDGEKEGVRVEDLLKDLPVAMVSGGRADPLLVPERVNGIEMRRPIGGIESEEQSHGH